MADRTPQPPPPVPVQPEVPAQPALQPEQPIVPPVADDPILERLIQALERREPGRERERETDAWKVMSQLKRMGVTDYNGEFNPEAADEWLSKLQ